MSPGVALVRRVGGEVRLQQVGDRLPGRFGDRGPNTASPLVAADVALVHGPGDPLVVDPLRRRSTVVELGGRSRCPDGVVLVVHGPDSLRQLGVGSGAYGTGRGGGRQA